MPVASTATNAQIGALIGMSRPGVSRLRSGNRRPSIATMRRVEAAFSWPIAEQVEALERGTYAQTFNNAAERALRVPA